MDERWPTQARCFEPSEDGKVLRELDRLTKEIDVQLAEEAAIKKKQGKAKRHAEQVAKHKKKAKKWTQSVEPPPPPTMSLNESAATMLLAEEQKEEARREALLKKGWTGKFPRVQEVKVGQEHHQYFFLDPRKVCASFGAEWGGWGV